LDDRFAGGDGDSYRQFQIWIVFVQELDGLLKPQSCPYGPLRVVLVGDGGAKEGQNCVAHQARQGAFVTIDRCDQMLESAVHDLRPIFRIHLFSCGSGTFDVTEQDGDYPPLARHSVPAARGF